MTDTVAQTELPHPATAVLERLHHAPNILDGIIELLNDPTVPPLGRRVLAGLLFAADQLATQRAAT